MKLIIEIDEATFKKAEEDKYNHLLDRAWDAIAHGIPLPKGHGRLIDTDELKKIIQENDVLNMRGFNVRICDIDNTPTIIEADKESEDNG